MIHEWPLEVARWVMEDFGKSLLKLRKARKLTQLQLAELIEVQPRLVSRWETGESKPHFDHIVRLAEILEVSLDMLVRGSDTSTAMEAFEITNKRLKELCRRVDQLPREDQDVICHVMDSLIRKEQMRVVLSGTLPPTP